MRAMIAYPPLEGKGSPMLTQNRQFQWMSKPSYLYPCVPASAATYLQSLGHPVSWADCITERKDWGQFEGLVRDFQPEIIAIETKAPVVRQHWAMLPRIKELAPGVKTVLYGDHAAGKPDESMERSEVDYVLTGGDYDFSIASIVKHLEEGSALGTGIVYRNDDGSWSNTGPYRHEGSLEDLPWIDRDLTNAHLYFEKWKKRLPFMWTMAGRDCPWGKCTFCSWTTTYPRFRTVGPEHLLNEMDMLISKHGAREIFDDSGSLPGGGWLLRFLEGMIDRKMQEKIIFDCNFRYDYLTQKNTQLMKKAGFRKLLIGLESANQRTLDILNKNLTREQIIEGSRLAKEAGLEIQLTVMVGYPWETKEDAYESLRLAKYLMNNGLAHMLQATVIMPYPGTPLFDLCQEKGWIRFGAEEYERYDMTEPVCELTDMDEEEVVRMAGQFYKLFLDPRFFMRQLANVRSVEDMDYIFRGSRAIWGHIKDFASLRRWGSDEAEATRKEAEGC
jgi:anaerobic magnesium-protoporphyrin IX monomethyl ester cyclase